MESMLARTLPCEDDGTGHSFGDAELANLAAVLDSGVLIAHNDGFTQQLEAAFAERYGVRHAIACSSGTSALQAALAALQLPEGAEAITTPLSDIGGVSPLLAEGLIPVFADVDPVTGNVDPDSVEAAISPATRVIVVTHLVGKPCDMTRLTEIAARHGLLIVEDCAQAYDARHAGRLVGTFGAVGTFSTQQTKHISSGEGGLLVTDDDDIAYFLRSWINKGVAGGVRARNEDHPMLGMNARMTELQAAVLLPQLARLDESVAARVGRARELSAALGDIQGLDLPADTDGEVQTYWKFLLSVDPERLPGARARIAEALDAHGALVAPWYLHLPLFSKSLFATYRRRLVGETVASTRGEAVAELDRFTGMRGFIDRAIVLWWNERMSPSDVARIADIIRAAVRV